MTKYENNENENNQNENRKEETKKDYSLMEKCTATRTIKENK